MNEDTRSSCVYLPVLLALASPYEGPRHASSAYIIWTAHIRSKDTQSATIRGHDTRTRMLGFFTTGNFGPQWASRAAVYGSPRHPCLSANAHKSSLYPCAIGIEADPCRRPSQQGLGGRGSKRSLPQWRPCRPVGPGLTPSYLPDSLPGHIRGTLAQQRCWNFAIARAQARGVSAPSVRHEPERPVRT